MSSATPITSRTTIATLAPSASPVPARLDDRLLVVCALSWATALIHATAAVEHVDENALYVLFFALLAPLQIWWGLLVYRRPTRACISLGAIASLLVAATWVISRTTGLPLGNRPWTPEPIGAIDATATANELTLALLALAWYCSQHGHHVPRGLGRLLTGPGICLVAVSALVLTAVGHGS